MKANSSTTIAPIVHRKRCAAITSPAWQYYKRLPNNEGLAECLCCHMHICCPKTANNHTAVALWSHLKSKHPIEFERAKNEQKYNRVKVSPIWDYVMRRETEGVAECKQCSYQFSLTYKQSTSQIWRHLKRFHPVEYQCAINKRDNPNQFRTYQEEMHQINVCKEEIDPNDENEKSESSLDDSNEASNSFSENEYQKLRQMEEKKGHKTGNNKQEILSTDEIENRKTIPNTSNKLEVQNYPLLLARNRLVTNYQSGTKTTVKSGGFVENLRRSGFVIASPAWTHFEKLPAKNMINCLHCHALLSPSTDLWYHLRVMHPTEHLAAREEQSNNRVIWHYFVKCSTDGMVNCLSCPVQIRVSNKNNCTNSQHLSLLWMHLKNYHHAEYERAIRQRDEDKSATKFFPSSNSQSELQNSNQTNGNSTTNEGQNTNADVNSNIKLEADSDVIDTEQAESASISMRAKNVNDCGHIQNSFAPENENVSPIRARVIFTDAEKINPDAGLHYFRPLTSFPLTVPVKEESIEAEMEVNPY